MSPRPAEHEEGEFEAAVRQARSGEFDAAIEAITRGATGAEPSSISAAANALAEVSGIAESAGDLGAAERAIGIAVELAPRYPDLQHWKACLLIRSGRYAEARRALDHAIAIHPGYVAARLERAMLDARAGLVGEALEALRALSGEHSIDDMRAFRRGLTSLERADWDEADSLLRHALNLPDEMLQRELGQVREQLEQGRAPEAVAALQALVSRHPGYPDLYALLGRAQIQLGHSDDAILALARALEIKPNYHAARVWLAHALESLGQLVPAQDQIALVLEQDPNQAEALQAKSRWSGRATARTRSALASH